MIPFLLLSLASAAPFEIECYRGAPLPNAIDYWAVQDAFIESQSPDATYGADPLLSAGPGKAILLRFGDLGRMVPPGYRIESASIELRPVLGARPLPSSAATLLKPWQEGPGRRGPKVNPIAPPKGAKSLQDAVSWSEALGGIPGVAWGQMGARGATDAASLEIISVYREDGTLVLSGLGDWGRQHFQQPFEMHGVRLEFPAVVDFASSEFPDPGARPKLRLSLVPVTPQGVDLAVDGLQEANGKWSASVTASAPTRARLSWVRNGVVAEQREVDLSPTAKQFEWIQAKAGDVVLVRLESGFEDPNPRNNARQSSSAAVAVSLLAAPGQLSERALADLAIATEQFLNETVLPHSRFSFAPNGSAARIRIEQTMIADPKVVRLKPNARFIQMDGTDPLRAAAVAALSAAGLPDMGTASSEPRALDPYRGVMGWGDTRNESDLPTILGFLREPWFDPLLSAIPAPPTDLLSATDVALLNGLVKDKATTLEKLLPGSVILRCQDAAGRLIANGTIRMVNVTEVPIRDGLAQVPNTVKWTENDVPLKLTSPAGEAEVLLKRWQLVDAFAKGNTDTAILTIRFNVPTTAARLDLNLAENRLVFLPAEIKARGDVLTDGNLTTSLTWPARQAGTLEIDLGKDRTLVGIELVLNTPSIWPRFQLSVNETGQTGNPGIWVLEPFGTSALVYRSHQTDGRFHLPIYSIPVRARSLRITVQTPSEAPVEIAEIRVFGGAEN